MKKLLFGLSAVALLASCNRDVEATEPTGGDNLAVVSGMQIVDMNEGFTITGKSAATALNYTYINYGFPPNVGGVDLEAVSSVSIRDVVFVTWHALDLDGGGDPITVGALSAYKYNTSTGKYEHKHTISFNDAEYYEAVANMNSATGMYEVFAAGQRDPDASGYLLANHKGAVVTRVDYNYITDQWDLSSKRELPLPSSAATGIAAAAGAYYVTTGNGTGAGPNIGGVYRVDYNLTNVSAAQSLTDALAVETHPGVTPPSANMTFLWRDGSQLNVDYNYTVNQTLHANVGYPFNSAPLTADGSIVSGIGADIDDERFDITFTVNTGTTTSLDSIIIAAGDNGMYLASDLSTAKASYGYCYSTAYDPGAGVVYYCSGEGGVYVIATAAFGGVLSSDWDLVGIFAPPSNTTIGGTTLPTNFDIKEINVYQSNKLTLAGGIGGVYFMELN